MRIVLIVLFSIFPIIAIFADTAPPPTVAQMQRIVDALVVQRNTALNAQAVADSNVVELRDEIAKAQARVKELEDLQAKCKK
jgi:hypothetical protein